MSRKNFTARASLVAGALAALVAPLALALPASPAASAAARSAPDPVTARGAAMARIGFAVDSCEGCQLQLSQADRRYHHVWHSKHKLVVDGRVAWTVRAVHATNLSVTIAAPWEKHTGYVTQVVFHYVGDHRGDPVSVRHAQRHKRGSYCFAGPGDDRVTVPLTLRKVKVDGARPHKVDGTLAFATTSRTFVKPYSRVFRGVGGAQDIASCGTY